MTLDASTVATAPDSPDQLAEFVWTAKSKTGTLKYRLIGTLLFMGGTWVAARRPYLKNMTRGQMLPFISDIAAHQLQALFVVGTIVIVVLFAGTLGILLHYLDCYAQSKKNLPELAIRALGISIIGTFAIAGLAIIGLAILDNVNYPKAHRRLLYTFVNFNAISAILLCVEFGFLRFGSRRWLWNISFGLKIVINVFSLIGGTAFFLLLKRKRWNTAAVVEWLLALLLVFYIATFILDMIAIRRIQYKASDRAIRYSSCSVWAKYKS